MFKNTSFDSGGGSFTNKNSSDKGGIMSWLFTKEVKGGKMSLAIHSWLFTKEVKEVKLLTKEVKCLQL